MSIILLIFAIFIIGGITGIIFVFEEYDVVEKGKLDQFSIAIDLAKHEIHCLRAKIAQKEENEKSTDDADWWKNQS